jgi:hypothetical protein
MQPRATVIGLWDYGWLSHDSVKLALLPSNAGFLNRYFASPEFHTSFLPSMKNERGIHGPFLVARLKPSDFVPLEETDLEHYLESVQLSDTPAEDDAARAKILLHLRRAFGGGCRCHVLTPDERHTELFHDWGFVFALFREFLFAGRQCDTLERYIIGYD